MTRCRSERPYKMRVNVGIMADCVAKHWHVNMYSNKSFEMETEAFQKFDTAKEAAEFISKARRRFRDHEFLIRDVEDIPLDRSWARRAQDGD